MRRNDKLVLVAKSKKKKPNLKLMAFGAALAIVTAGGLYLKIGSGKQVISVPAYEA